jgi:hypothetical protein
MLEPLFSRLSSGRVACRAVAALLLVLPVVVPANLAGMEGRAFAGDPAPKEPKAATDPAPGKKADGGSPAVAEPASGSKKTSEPGAAAKEPGTTAKSGTKDGAKTDEETKSGTKSGTKPDGGSVAASPRRAAPRSLDEALRRLASRSCDITFADAPLADVAAFLSKISDVDVILAPALRVAGTDALSAIDVKLTRVNLRELAEVAAKMTETRLVFRDGVLQFTTPEDARGRPVLKIYSLADLTFRLRNFPGPDLQIHLKSQEWEDEKESDAASAFDDPAKIEEMVRTMTGEGTWDDEDISVSTDERKMVVRQYPEVHREIARLLALLRAAK